MKQNGDLACGQRVMLNSFDGQATAPTETRDDEDYWKLVSSKGVVSELGDDTMSGRALVTFDDDPAKFGLACHNSRPKSLWIKIEDLKGLGEIK